MGLAPTGREGTSVETLLLTIRAGRIVRIDVADNTLDLYDLRKFGTASTKVELDVIDGVTGTPQHLVTSLGATNI